MLINLFLFLLSLGYSVINDNKNIQKGLSCGYISANCSHRFFSLIQCKNEQWINENILDCAHPNVTLMNHVLGISGNTAIELTAEQIMILVSHMTNDNNLNWLFMVDINLFKSMAMNNFKNLKLPTLNGKRWAVFCVNDAKLSDNERMQSMQESEFKGSRWFTVAIWM